MSLIPYELDRRAVVLRHQSAIVLFDPQSRQLSVRSHPTEEDSASDTCPTCHRSFRDDSAHAGEQSSNLPDHTTYMDPSYFRKLQRTIPESAISSRPGSPRRIDSETSTRRASTIIAAPVGVEFIASQPATGGQGISKKAFSPNYFKTFFKEERELGRGGKGVVLLVTHAIDGVHLGQFACKRVPVGDDHAWLEKVLIEVQTLQNLSHPNLVSYRHVWLEDFQISNFGPSVPCAFILQQYCNGKDLHQYVLGDTKSTLSPSEMKERLRRRSKGGTDKVEGMVGPKRIGFEEIYSFFKDITSGLHHLHSHGFIHRDIKPQNCLLNHVDGRIRVLLSDFGEVQVSHVERIGTGATGTVSYCAPEVLRRHRPRDLYGNFTVKSDVFSVGMIVHFLSFGGLPYIHADDMNEENEDVEMLKAEIVAWSGFDEERRRGRNDLPDMLYKFLKRLLAIDPDERPSTEEILRMIRAAQDSDYDTQSLGDGKHPRISVAESPSPYSRSTFRRNSSSSQQRSTTRSSRLVHSTLASEVGPDVGLHQYASVQDESPDGTGPRHAAYSSAMIRAHSKGLQHEDNSPIGAVSSSRLALPPPPQRFYQVTNGLTTSVLRVLIFMLKYWSITAPCSPLSPRPSITYPLILMAILDFISPKIVSGWSFFLSRSFYLLIIHFVIISWTTRLHFLCESLQPFG